MTDYKDQDGNTVSLLKLCSLEPEWARSRIEVLSSEGKIKDEKIAELEAHIRSHWHNLEYKNEQLESIAKILGKTVFYIAYADSASIRQTLDEKGQRHEKSS